MRINSILGSQEVKNNIFIFSHSCLSLTSGKRENIRELHCIIFRFFFNNVPSDNKLSFRKVIASFLFIRAGYSKTLMVRLIAIKGEITRIKHSPNPFLYFIFLK